ncbi:MAG: pseudouridine synthase, partial [Maritimibacter sp.]
GGLKRKLELPATGWVRKYRVRVHGNPSEDDLTPLRKGIEIEGERFQAMSVSLDRHQGANAWLTVGLREGKNREIRRAMEAVGLSVNRLLRVSYGPFRLGDLKPGEVEEIRAKVLRDQLGLENGEEAETPKAKKPVRRRGQPPKAPRGTPAPKPVQKSGQRSAQRPGQKSAPKPGTKPTRGGKPPRRG